MVDFHGIWLALKRRWWVPLLTAALIAAAVGIWMVNSPSIYTAVARLSVGQQRANILPGDPLSVEDLKSLEVLKTIQQEIIGQDVLVTVANEHRLREDPAFAKPKKNGEPYQDDEMVTLLKKRVSSLLDRGTRHIEVKVDDTDAARSRAICASIIALATRQSSNATSETAKQAERTLTEAQVRTKAKVDQSQKAVDDFRALHPDLPLDDHPSELKTNSVEDALRSAGISLTTAQGDIARLQNTISQIDAAGGKMESLLRLPDIGQREDVANLQRSLGEKQTAFAAIDDEYGYKHAVHQQAVKEINETNNQLVAAVTRAISSMKKRLEKVQQDAAGLQSQLVRLKRGSVDFQKIAGTFATLLSALNADRADYDRVLNKLNDAVANTAVGDSVLRIVEAPLQPTYPNKPRRRLITGVAGMLGLGAGIGLVLLLHFMDRTLRTIQAGENLLHLPGLVALPMDPVTDLKAGLLHERPQAMAQSEAFRSLRTALSILGKGTATRSYLFTSARQGEGTSYAAMNFALSLAQQGYRTLLIDANLRHPALDGVFLKQRPATGLADHLSGQGTRDASACQRTEIPGVYLFSAGITSRHPSEVLNEQAFAVLLQDAAKWFHKIVIDTPPVGYVTDALPLARHADAVCLVVKAAATPRAEVKRAANKLAMAGARPVGFILSSASKEALSGGFTGDFAAGFTPAPSVRALPAPAVS